MWGPGSISSITPTPHLPSSLYLWVDASEKLGVRVSAWRLCSPLEWNRGDWGFKSKVSKVCIPLLWDQICPIIKKKVDRMWHLPQTHGISTDLVKSYKNPERPTVGCPFGRGELRHKHCSNNTTSSLIARPRLSSFHHTFCFLLVSLLSYHGCAEPMYLSCSLSLNFEQEVGATAWNQ